MCLIGIAHLPEKQNSLRLRKTFELRPCTTTNIGDMLAEKMKADKGIPKEALPIVANLFHAVKLICGKVLPIMPISGNVICADGNLNN